MYVCSRMYICVYACMYVCTRKYVCMCVFMYVCMYGFSNVLIPPVASHKRYSPRSFEPLLVRPETGGIKKQKVVSRVETRTGTRVTDTKTSEGNAHTFHFSTVANQETTVIQKECKEEK